jgi:hypothetical protein
MIIIAYLDNKNIEKVIKDGYDVYIDLSKGNIEYLTEEFIERYKNKLWFSNKYINRINLNYIENYKIVIFPEKDKSIIINNYDGMITRYYDLYQQKMKAKIRYGILICGRLRCYEENLVPQILNYLSMNKNEWIDIHINLNEEKEKLEEYLNKPYINLPIIATIDCNKYETRRYYLEYYNYNSNIKCLNPLTLMPSYYTLMKAYSQLNFYKIKNKINYDLIIKYRPDIVSNQIINFNNYLFIRNEKNKVYIPNIYIFGINEYKSNDQIAIGNEETMEKYCMVYPYIDTYLSKNNLELYHPETILGYHLNTFNIKIEKFNYNYVLNIRRHN